jgi:hypothetical protein
MANLSPAGLSVETGPPGPRLERTSEPAIAAGFIAEPGEGEACSSAREHGMHALRHFYASVLVDAGENVKAVSEYVGHSDPALTLPVYAHLMPTSRERTRKVVDRVFLRGRREAGGNP